MKPVAKKTISAGFKPTRQSPVPKRHVVAVVGFDNVVLSDLATPCTSSDVSATRTDGPATTCGSAVSAGKSGQSI